MSVDSAPKETALRLAMLLHDVAKPQCYSEENGTGRFRGHAQLGSEMARKILRRLKYDNETVDTVTELVLHHFTPVGSDLKNVRKWLNRLGVERLRQLIEVRKADAEAHHEKYRAEKRVALDEAEALIDDVIARQLCFSLKDLAVNGRDLIDAGIQEGPEIGALLRKLLEMVIEDELPNNKTALLDAARKIVTIPRFTEHL